jgi:hypothetical protein
VELNGLAVSIVGKLLLLGDGDNVVTVTVVFTAGTCGSKLLVVGGNAVVGWASRGEAEGKSHGSGDSCELHFEGWECCLRLIVVFEV